jgi:hypothetical protein
MFKSEMARISGFLLAQNDWDDLRYATQVPLWPQEQCDQFTEDSMCIMSSCPKEYPCKIRGSCVILSAFPLCVCLNLCLRNECICVPPSYVYLPLFLRCV